VVKSCSVNSDWLFRHSPSNGSFGLQPALLNGKSNSETPKTYNGFIKCFYCPLGLTPQGDEGASIAALAPDWRCGESNERRREMESEKRKCQ
jgi:hypothetical protein